MFPRTGRGSRAGLPIPLAAALSAAIVLCGCEARRGLDAPRADDPDPRRSDLFEMAEELRRGGPPAWSPNRLDRAVEMYDRVAEPYADGTRHSKAPDAMKAAGLVLASMGRDLEAAGRFHAAWLLAPDRMRDAAEAAVRAYVRAGFPDRAGRLVKSAEESAQAEGERRFAADLRDRLARCAEEFPPLPPGKRAERRPDSDPRKD